MFPGVVERVSCGIGPRRDRLALAGAEASEVLQNGIVVFVSFWIAQLRVPAHTGSGCAHVEDDGSVRLHRRDTDAPFFPRCRWRATRR